MDQREYRIFSKRINSIHRHQRLRAQEMGVPLPYEAKDLRRHCEPLIGTLCPYCGVTIRAKTYSCDHATPLSLSGSLSLENIKVICLRCNQIKGNMTGEEFQRLLEILTTFSHDAKKSILSRLRSGGRMFH